jgi:molecular chaperone Hsp33
MPPVTQLISRGLDVGAVLEELAGDWELRSQQALQVRFACRCSRAKVEAVLLGLGADELLRLTRERDGTEAICEYCKTRYFFTMPEVEELLARL